MTSCFKIFHSWKTIKRSPYEPGMPVTFITQKCRNCGEERRKMVGPGR